MERNYDKRKPEPALKLINIPYDLFVSLLRYHLLDVDDCEAEIQKGLEKKLDELVMHDLYSRSKAAPTAEEREKARQEYLDKRGVPDSFRWSVSLDER